MFTILLVEDESIIARDIGRSIDKLEYVRYLVADTYTSAIELIDSEIPDLVLLDIRLYEDNDAGLKIARYINEKYRIPIIFLSGYATDNYLQKAKKEMPVTFIVKPVDNLQLQAALTMAIQNTTISKLKKITFHGRYFESVKEEDLTPKIIAETPLSYEKVSPEDILLIKTFNHQKKNTVLVKLTNSSLILVSLNIQKALTLLPGNFVKIHSSFIVNKDQVNGVIGTTSARIGHEQIQFGTAFKKEKAFRLFR